MVQITYSDYDNLLEIFEKINVKTFWPGVEQIDIFEKNPDKWIYFVCYLLEAGVQPKTNAEKYSKKSLNQFVAKHLEFVNDEDAFDRCV
jgi:hypothetical protein